MTCVGKYTFMYGSVHAKRDYLLNPSVCDPTREIMFFQSLSPSDPGGEITFLPFEIR